jgi:hypothetical protein
MTGSLIEWITEKHFDNPFYGYHILWIYVIILSVKEH